MRILVVMAHPDDPEFAAGGTIARWIQEGHEVIYCLATRGEKGSNDPMMTPEQLATIREKEQRQAAATLGVREVIFLNYADGALEPNLALRRDIVRLIRRYRPEIVVTMDPQTLIRGNRYINHNDHRAIGLATLDAIFPAAGNRMYFPELLQEGLEPHQVREIYLSTTEYANHWVDITDVFALKMAALRCHASQIRDYSALEQRLRERLRHQIDGREILAESFRRIILEG
ncbi:PIG-L deacetylase family protein [Thermoflexus sp.]|uniref:PIG-L deacetylase family protein n=1 Tax=Thermoflexus sp. TaxID=1969742 RepID=UPI0025E6F5C6|nr:PIG-L deacetylase family protein [Thermoflexus sp.]MDW8179773.1 PIG-L deacetylase family protein [Anaerolineae bacterium]MCS6963414.1 PIG-L family deacetylase [Thermoflexus sp.]MCS7350322.1 PIG-L family deacetylase [Thermoflexus sp.]MCX7689832.1 PIG-L family deacetylase [Thermoflexus sp.]MDW8183680.1 PIG-L deacetylase family protein [Anaerolineae bacterium]